jgi:hypothetical protein
MNWPHAKPRNVPAPHPKKTTPEASDAEIPHGTWQLNETNGLRWLTGI